MQVRDDYTLYVGIDESNNGRIPLIVCACFSSDPSDIKFLKRIIPRNGSYRDFRLNHCTLTAQLFNGQSRGKDYRFVVDKSGNLEITSAEPLLVNAYLEKSEIAYSSARIFIDGPVRKDDITHMLNETIIEAKIEGVIKRKPVFYYPDILIRADSFVHAIYREPGLIKRKNVQEKRVFI